MARKSKTSTSHDTPVMRQFREIKGRYPDALLLFRMGDFYEMFYDDAVVASRLLGLALTSRDKGKEDGVPMCGVPHHSVATHMQKLLESGHRVAICEQLEDPASARGIVRRDVVRVVTPGSNVDTDLLDAGRANYLAGVVPADTATGDGPWGIAAADISTGEMIVTDAADPTDLAGDLARLDPREVIVDPGWKALARLLSERIPSATVTRSPRMGSYLDPGEAAARIREFVDDVPWGIGDGGPGNRGLAAAAAVLDYLARTQPGRELPIRRIVPVRSSDRLVLDDNTIRHLELTQAASGERRASLVGWMDRCATAMGSRLLRSWVLSPLLDVARIRRRQDAVEALMNDAEIRGSVREMLSGVCDIDRVMSRVVLQAVTPREVGTLRETLAILPDLERIVDGLSVPGSAPGIPDAPGDLVSDLSRALVDSPPVQSREGGIFRKGWNAELDRLIELSTSGKDAISAMEAREREATGIGSLKIRYNRVFGWFIEVTRANLASVPEDRYIRKQTLATGERYYTEELKELEAQILGADERRKALESELFRSLVEEIGRRERELRDIGEALARLDVLASNAELASRQGYVRPRVTESGRLRIRAGRHPVVEAFGAPDGFVPNDVDLDTEGERIWVITGPNMSGKSTFMRQVALSTIMAQAGSFIPAAEADIGLADRIFTRVGASDNLAWGQSTFMVEMTETATILRHATRRSLVVLDEVGRGTSTFDGLSIAWAVAEYLHDHVGSRTLFATHYHELTDLARNRAHACNYHVRAEEYGEGIVFLREVEKGSTSRSYGIQVARLAGLPEPVLDRARVLLGELESGSGPAADPDPRRDESQLSLFRVETAPSTALVDAIERADPETMTPMDALALLARLKDLV